MAGSRSMTSGLGHQNIGFARDARRTLAGTELGITATPSNFDAGNRGKFLVPSRMFGQRAQLLFRADADKNISSFQRILGGGVGNETAVRSTNCEH